MARKKVIKRSRVWRKKETEEEREEKGLSEKAMFISNFEAKNAEDLITNLQIKFSRERKKMTEEKGSLDCREEEGKRERDDQSQWLSSA